MSGASLQERILPKASNTLQAQINMFSIFQRQQNTVLTKLWQNIN